MILDVLLSVPIPTVDQVLAGVETSFRPIYSFWRYESKPHGMGNQSNAHRCDAFLIRSAQIPEETKRMRHPVARIRVMLRSSALATWYWLKDGMNDALTLPPMAGSYISFNIPRLKSRSFEMLLLNSIQYS